MTDKLLDAQRLVVPIGVLLTIITTTAAVVGFASAVKNKTDVQYTHIGDRLDRIEERQEEIIDRFNAWVRKDELSLWIERLRGRNAQLDIPEFLR